MFTTKSYVLFLSYLRTERYFKEYDVFILKIFFKLVMVPT